METIFAQLAKARLEAARRNESFIRVPMSLVAEIVAALMGRKTSEQVLSEKTEGDPDE